MRGGSFSFRPYLLGYRLPNRHKQQESLPGNVMASQRKHQFIDRKQQVRFAVSVMLFSLLFPLIFLSLAASPYLSGLLFGEDAASVQPLLNQFIAFTFSHWWLALLTLGFLSVATVLFSHLIFGPMRRFEIVLKQKKEFPDKPVFCQVRRGDYFQEFSRLFDEVLNGLQAAETPLKGNQERVLETGEIHQDPSDPAEGASPDLPDARISG